MNEKYPTGCKRRCTLKRWLKEGKLAFKSCAEANKPDYNPSPGSIGGDEPDG